MTLRASFIGVLAALASLLGCGDDGGSGTATSDTSTGPGGTSGGGAPGEPGPSALELPGLLAWYRADLGVTVDGDLVDVWADQSGQTNDARFLPSLEPNAPVFTPPTLTTNAQGRPGLAFVPGAAVGCTINEPCSVLFAEGVTTSNAVTVLAVVETAPVAGNELPLTFLSAPGLAVSLEASTPSFSLGTFFEAAGATEPTYTVTSGVPSRGSARSAVEDPSGSLLRKPVLWVAANDAANNRFSVGGLDTTFGAVGPTPIDGVRIGGPVGYQGFAGLLHEVALFERSLTDEELEAAKAELAARWPGTSM